MEERDHKKLGPKLGLFYIDPVVGKGLPMFLPKGAIVKRELENFIIEEETRRGYQHVHTPDLARLALYEKSGHYPHYRDSMYAPITIDDEQFMLRPMTCPHHFQLYLSTPRSYRDLPMRIAELAQLYRYEQSGELMGLQRVRTFCLADAHIICASEEQAVAEMGGALDLIEHVNGVLGLKFGEDYRYELSLHDPQDKNKYGAGNEMAWTKSEELLRQLMKKRGVDFQETVGGAAFYGPKIDIQMKNVNGKEDTAFTVQYDFLAAGRFELVYIGENGNNRRAFVVHRSSIGSVERTLAFLIEKHAGAFPLWLTPVQIAILPVSRKHNDYAAQIAAKLRRANLRVELKDENETLGKKIRQAKTDKIPYLAVIGDKEVETDCLEVENRTEKLGRFAAEKLIERLRLEITNKQI